MPDAIVVIGVPTALGGHLAGMEQTPGELRRAGLLHELGRDAGLADTLVRDGGDLPIEPGSREDPDPRAKNRALIADFLPREADFVADRIRSTGPPARPLILGGDCTVHAGALAGIRRADPDRRLALVWFDAHGDFNTPTTTPSGDVWGMPFAMLCGIGDADLVRACEGPTVMPTDAALVGGQVLDEQESRTLVRSGVAHFGPALLATPAGMAAFGAWIRAKKHEVDGVYIAVDFDVLDRAGGWAVQFPEPDGLDLPTAEAAIVELRGQLRVVGFGASGINLANGDARRTQDALVRLAGAAFESGGR
jgi:arginase